MSTGFRIWVEQRRGLEPVDRLVAMEIATRVGDDGRWHIKMKDLMHKCEMTRGRLRRSLDRLADGHHKMLAFRAKAYLGKAQASHEFCLVRNDGERDRAIADGFSFSREILDRSQTSLAPCRTFSSNDRAKKDGGRVDRGSVHRRTEGGSSSGPRVGPLLDRQRNQQNTPSEPLSHPERRPPGVDQVEGGRASVEDLPDRALFVSMSAVFAGNPADSERAALAEWKKLTPEDRQHATAHAPAFMATAVKYTNPPHRKRYLAERSWRGFIARDAHAIDTARPSATSETQPSSDLHAAMRRQLRANLGDGVYVSWLSGFDVAVSGDTIVVSLPTRLKKSHVSQHHEAPVLMAARAHDPSIKRVEFAVGDRPRALQNAGLVAPG